MNQKSFEQLKNILSRSSVLRCADFFLSCELWAGWLKVLFTSVLTQTEETGHRPVAFCSRQLIDARKGYCTHEQEFLPALCALTTRQSYLHRSKARTRSVRYFLIYLDSQKKPFQKVDQMNRVNAKISQPPAIHDGEINVIADAVSPRYSQNHHVTTDIGRNLLSVTTIFVKRRTVQNSKSEHKKDQKLKSISGQPTHPDKRNENNFYWNETLCTPQKSSKNQNLGDGHESVLEVFWKYQKALEIVKNFFTSPR